MVIYDEVSGKLFQASLPNLSGKVTITTIANITDSRAMWPHPTDANLLILFNATEGILSINTSTGQVNQLISTSAFNTATNNSPALSDFLHVRIRGTKLVIRASNDPSGSVVEYDPNNNNITTIFRGRSLGRLFECESVNQLIMSGYQSPSNIIFSVDLTKDQVKIVAGVGTDNVIADGNAFTEAKFREFSKIFKYSSDTYLVCDSDSYVRWIQGNQVGTFDRYALGGDTLCWVVSVGVQNVIVWE